MVLEKIDFRPLEYNQVDEIYIAQSLRFDEKNGDIMIRILVASKETKKILNISTLTKSKPQIDVDKWKFKSA